MSNAKLLVISVVCLIIGWILIQAAPALVPVVIAVVTAYLLNPLVDALEKKLKGKRKLAIGLVLVSFLLVLALVINLILPPIIQEASEFVSEYETISANLGNSISGALEFLENSGIPESVLAEVQNVLASLLSWLGAQIASGISKALGFVDMVLIIIMAVYFLSSGKSMVKNIYDSAPVWLKPTLKNLRTETHSVIWSYAKTQLIIAVVVGLVSTIAFMVIGVRFSGLLGLLSGVLNFIPLFGSLIAGAFATIVALVTGGLTQAIVTLAAVLVIQQVEGNFITPKLQGKSTGLHPVFIMIIILVANQMWGVAGMFIAVPLFGLARLFFKESASLIGKMK